MWIKLHSDYILFPLFSIMQITCLQLSNYDPKLFFIHPSHRFFIMVEEKYCVYAGSAISPPWFIWETHKAIRNKPEDRGTSALHTVKNNSVNLQISLVIELPKNFCNSKLLKCSVYFYDFCVKLKDVLC